MLSRLIAINVQDLRKILEKIGCCDVTRKVTKLSFQIVTNVQDLRKIGCCNVRTFKVMKLSRKVSIIVQYLRGILEKSGCCNVTTYKVTNLSGQIFIIIQGQVAILEKIGCCNTLSFQRRDINYDPARGVVANTLLGVHNVSPSLN